MFFLSKPREGFSPNHEKVSPQTTRGLLPKPRGGFSPNHEGASPQTTRGLLPKPRGGFSPNHARRGAIHLALSKGRVDGTWTSVRACRTPPAGTAGCGPASPVRARCERPP